MTSPSDGPSVKETVSHPPCPIQDRVYIPEMGHLAQNALLRVSALVRTPLSVTQQLSNEISNCRDLRCRWVCRGLSCWILRSATHGTARQPGRKSCSSKRSLRVLAVGSALGGRGVTRGPMSLELHITWNYFHFFSIVFLSSFGFSIRNLFKIYKLWRKIRKRLHIRSL